MNQKSRPLWQQLSSLLDRLDRSGWNSLTVQEIKQLCRWYRQVTIDLSRARSDGDDPELVRYLNFLAARAHGRVYRTKPVGGGLTANFLLRGFAQVVRRRARPVLAAAGLFLLTALASWLAVVREPETAYSLFDEHMVEYENLRLERQEGEYRGNFTFDVGVSPLVAVAIIGNNVKVAALGFALGALACVPGALLLVFNGRMLGTLSGLVWNHGYFLDFYSLILTHGVLELSAICIAGGGGFLLGWAVIAPGGRTRRDALKQVAGDALALAAGSMVLLVMAGLLEAYVTPHFPPAVRWTVAAVTAVLLAAYLGFAGRSQSKQAAVGNLQVAVDQRRSQA